MWVVFKQRDYKNRRKLPLFATVIMVGVAPWLLASSPDREESIAWIRAQFVEAMRVGGVWEAAPVKDRKGMPTWYTALRPAMRQPTDLILEAVNRSLQGANKDERAGALSAYTEMLSNGRAEKSQTTFQVLLKLYAEDDGQTRYYTGTIVNALAQYPSRETLQILMDQAAKEKDAKERENTIRLAAYLLTIELPIYQQTKPLEVEQILASFQVWYEQNKARISFDAQGRPSVKGANPNAKPRALTSEERARIRQDPACVLELLQGSTGGIEVSEERMQQLMNKCGEALYGPEGARLVKQSADTTQAGDSKAFDLQMNLAAARAKYPMLDAALLAVAYVAADDPDPKHRELAVMTLDDIGMPEDIVRVLKSESKDVRQKTMELADEQKRDKM